MSRRERPVSLPNLAHRIWQLLDVAQKRQCAVVLVVSALAACLTVVGVAGIAPFFAVLADPTAIERAPMLAWLRHVVGGQTPESLLVRFGIAFVAVLVIANLVNVLAILSIGRFSQGVGARFHTLLFNEYLDRDLPFHARSNSAVLSTRVIQDVNRTVGGIIQSGLTLIGSAISIALIAAAVLVVNPLIGSAAALLLGSSYALTYALVRRRLIRNGTIVSQHWAARAKVIAESFATIKDVMLFGARPDRTAQVARQSRAIAAAQASTLAIASSPRYVLECVTGAGLIGAALWIYGEAGAGQWLTQLAFLGFAAYRLLPALQQAFSAFARIRTERAGFESIADDLLRARQRAAPAGSQTGDAEWRGRPRRAIRLTNVSYRHAARRPGGVEDVCLEIPAGALAGIVGPNGAGKTTLAELVLGLLEADAGRIEIDGIELNAANRNAWLNAVAYVPQQIALLDASIAENIAFGTPRDEIDSGRVVAAAQRAQLEALVRGLPEGLATVIGEHGVQLSGGQRQRVGFARALYRRASLLVLDEATNALDALSEEEVVALLRGLRGRCTVILIAHRSSALAACDLLFELDSGRLVAQRAFDDRAQRAGVHARQTALR
jgi:HlyD family secretion protein